MDRRQKLQHDLVNLTVKINTLSNSIQELDFDQIEQDWNNLSRKLMEFDRFVMKETEDGWPILDFSNPFDEAISDDHLDEMIESSGEDGDDEATIVLNQNQSGREELDAANITFVIEEPSEDPSAEVTDTETGELKSGSDEEYLTLPDLEDDLYINGRQPATLVAFPFGFGEHRIVIINASAVENRDHVPDKCRISWEDFEETVGQELKDEALKCCQDLEKYKRDLDDNLGVVGELATALKEMDELMNENANDINPEAKHQTVSWLKNTEEMMRKYKEVKETVTRFRNALPSKSSSSKLLPSQVILPGENFEESRPFPDAWGFYRFPF